MFDVTTVEILTFSQVFEIAMTLIIAVMPLAIMFAVLAKMMNLFIGFVSGNRRINL